MLTIDRSFKGFIYFLYVFFKVQKELYGKKVVWTFWQFPYAYRDYLNGKL